MAFILGCLYNTLGAFSAASLYIPFKKVRGWAWETYWNVANTLAYAVTPVVAALITVPQLANVLRSSPTSSIVACCGFGFCWGIGNLLWGLSIRYLGLSLGYALTLGYCAAFGTIIPPIYYGTFSQMLQKTSGIVTLGSVVVCLAGIAVCGWAGSAKDRELSPEHKKKTIQEFHFTKGMIVALLCGITSACFAFAIEAGKPIAQIALDFDTNPNFVNNPVCMLALGGGAISGFVWCVLLNIKNRTLREYCQTRQTPLVSNYLLCTLSGTVAYLGFMFYGMCTPNMGTYGFASWTIYMALIIAFSNIWALWFREWKGSSKRTMMTIVLGIIILVASAVLTGLGAYLEMHSM